MSEARSSEGPSWLLRQQLPFTPHEGDVVMPPKFIEVTDADGKVLHRLRPTRWHVEPDEHHYAWWLVIEAWEAVDDPKGD